MGRMISQRAMVEASLARDGNKTESHNSYPIRVVKPAPVPVAVPERRAA